MPHDGNELSKPGAIELGTGAEVAPVLDEPAPVAASFMLSDGINEQAVALNPERWYKQLWL
jgi:hypothetical protein